MSYDDEDSQLEGALGDIPSADYPPDLLADRRATFQAQIRDAKDRQKKGCRGLGIFLIAATLGLTLFLAYQAYTTIIYLATSGMFWVVANGI